jgi:hypothetical protein
MERASLPPPPGLRRDQCEADLEHRAKATADKLSSKLTTRSEGVLEYCASVRIAPRDREVGDAEGAVEKVFMLPENQTGPGTKRSCRPLRAGRLVGSFLGLKPQTEPANPLGTNPIRHPQKTALTFI